MRDHKPGLVPSTEGLTVLLEVLGRRFNYTVVDLSSTCDEACLENMIHLSSDVVVVLTPELPCLWRTDWLIQLLSALGGEEKLRLVVNRSHRNDEIREKQVQDTLRHPVHWSLPNDYGSAIESINQGKPLISINHSALADSYTKLAHSLAGVPMQKKRRTLESLFSF
jgi:pilus assembly protein CpaE